jgi:hypothetical protein
MLRRVPSKQSNNRVARQVDQRALFRLGMLLLCGLMIAGGFLYAGRQHFVALRYGYETENLRKVHEELAEEQRRFLVEREAALSPGRLERAARRLGLQPMQSSQIDPLGNGGGAEQKPTVTQETRAKVRDNDAGAKRQRKTDANKPI